jgi:hypothetical protein
VVGDFKKCNTCNEAYKVFNFEWNQRTQKARKNLRHKVNTTNPGLLFFLICPLQESFCAAQTSPVSCKVVFRISEKLSKEKL